jgi:hypothetical protein
MRTDLFSVAFSTLEEERTPVEVTTGRIFRFTRSVASVRPLARSVFYDSDFARHPVNQ